MWRRHLAVRLAVVVVLLGLLPFLTRPPVAVAEQYRLWATHLSQSGRERWPGFRDGYTVYQSVRETVNVWEGAGRPFPYKEPLESTVYRVLQSLAAVGVLGWCLYCRRAYPSEGDHARLVNLGLALGCGWLMLFGPAVEHAGFAFLAPFQAWALTDATALRRSGFGGRALLYASAVCVLVFGWGALTRPIADAVPLVLTTLPVGTALFVIWLILDSRRPTAKEAGNIATVPPGPDQRRRSA
jgi:hypothetical protein